MRVRATKTGYFNGLRIPETDSEEFDVPDGSKATWFVPVKKTRQTKPENEAEQGQGGEAESTGGLV